ncbi:unnamed protein product [Closterium sp. NIES-53]
MNPVLKEFTFLSRSAKTSSRIDRALVSAPLLPSLSEASHCRPLKGLSDHWFGVKVTFKISLQLCMGPGIWRCKAAEIGRPGAAKAVAAVCEVHGKAGSGDFTALMGKMNMALRKYSTEERKRVKATLTHLDAAVTVLQQEVMRNPYCSARKEELKVKESQLAAYLASEQERVSLMAGVKELREGELPGKLMSAKVKTRKERTMITSLQWKGTVRKESCGILEAASEFYAELFSEPTPAADSTFWLVAPDRKLGEAQSQLLVADWFEAEVKEALDGMAKGKSPGADGIQKEFFSQHWEGVRQGCPLAPYLFLCAVEPLYQEAIRRKLGISNPYGDRLAYLGYADDTTLVLKGKRQIGRAVKLLNEFGEKSGLRVNNEKSALLPLGKNLRRKPDNSSTFKWVRSNEAERVLGVWISPSGDASGTWEIILSRTTAELGKWKIHYLSTSGRVAVVNGYINPILAFQAQVYPPPSEIWAKLVKLLHNFVTGNHSTAGKHFALWSQELLFTARGEGGLGVRDPCAELGGLAARRIALLASQPLGLRADLALAALDVPDLQVFWAHAGLIKQWEGRCERWKQTCELFLESSFPSCIGVSSVWEVEQEMLLFNRCLLLNGKSPAGRQKAAKSLKRSVVGDLIKVTEGGSRTLETPRELEWAFGGSEGAKLAKRVFDAAPDEWKQMLMAPVTARTVLTASKFFLKAGTSYGV